jgi:hypothetical protein
MLLCLGRKGIVPPQDLFDLFPLLLKSIERSFGSTLGLLLLIGIPFGSLLEVAICFHLAVDKFFLLVMVGAPITILGFLVAALLRATAPLLWRILSFFGMQPVSTASTALRFPFFCEGFLEPRLCGSLLLILYFKMVETPVKESFITNHAVVFILLIKKVVLH